MEQPLIELNTARYNRALVSVTPLRVRAKIIETHAYHNKVHLEWEVISHPFKGRRVDDFIYCFGQHDAHRWEQEKLFRLGIVHELFREGELFDVSKLKGLTTFILLSPTSESSTTPIVVLRDGEEETDYMAYRWFKANSHNPLLKGSKFSQKEQH